MKETFLDSRPIRRIVSTNIESVNVNCAMALQNYQCENCFSNRNKNGNVWKHSIPFVKHLGTLYSLYKKKKIFKSVQKI